MATEKNKTKAEDPIGYIRAVSYTFEIGGITLASIPFDTNKAVSILCGVSLYALGRFGNRLASHLQYEYNPVYSSLEEKVWGTKQ